MVEKILGIKWKGQVNCLEVYNRIRNVYFGLKSTGASIALLHVGFILYTPVMANVIE